MFVDFSAVITWKTVWFVTICLNLTAYPCHYPCHISIVDTLHLDWGVVVLEDELIKIFIGICVVSEYRLVFSISIIIDIVTSIMSYVFVYTFVLCKTLVAVPTREVLFYTSSLGCVKLQ